MDIAVSSLKRLISDERRSDSDTVRFRRINQIRRRATELVSHGA